MRMVKALIWLGIAIAAPGGQAVAADARWPGFEIIVWQPQTPAAYSTMKALGITAGMVLANRESPGADVTPRTAALRAAGLRWYVENIATDFYAAYHRYLPGQPVNAEFLAAQSRWHADPTDPTAFFRTPSLSDAAWMERIRARLQATVHAHAAGRPLFYDLGDETGIADLTAAWDFDRSPTSLAAMRVWLRSRYGELDALNARWGTRFAQWDDVVPMTVQDVLRPTQTNPASWFDFKAWMDMAFARALRAGTDAIHAADPTALSGIEGAQRPGMGGYDYGLLAGTADVMEIYPDDSNLELVRSFAPSTIILTTSALDGPRPGVAIWQAVLRGSRGLVLWDAAGDIVLPDGTIGPRGAAAGPLFAALHGRAVAALLESEPEYDPVAIVYSPESDRMQWVLDRISAGGTWAERDADIENEDNAVRASRRRMTFALARHGLRPRWVTAEQIARGELPEATRVLLLPQTIALSDATVASIMRFAAGGGTVLADGTAGRFDAQGRTRAANALAGLVGNDGLPANWLARLDAAGAAPTISLARNPGNVAMWVSRRGNARIVALMADAAAGGGPSPPRQVDLDFGHVVSVQDLRSGEHLGTHARLQLWLDPISPVVLELSAAN